MDQCEAKIRQGVSAQNFMRLGWTPQWEQCTNKATLEVTVKSKKKSESGKMKLCAKCLPKFEEYATLPWTVKSL
jgi:hypothetical protein